MSKSIFILLSLSTVLGAAFAQRSTPPETATDPLFAETDSIAPVKIEQAFFNADSIHIGTYYYTGTELDSTIYIKSNKRKVKVLFDMPEYEGGYDALKCFFEEEFAKIENKEENMNALVLVYILLEEGKITDIHIGDRIAYHNHDINYDKKITEILFKTQEKWIVPANEEIPLLFVYLFPLN